MRGGTCVAPSRCGPPLPCTLINERPLCLARKARVSVSVRRARSASDKLIRKSNWRLAL